MPADMAGLDPGWHPAGAEPTPRPALDLRQRGLELAAHFRELVLNSQRRSREDRALDHATALQLLHPLRQQAVGKLRDRLGDLGEAERTVHQHAQDRAGPATPDELDRLVVEGAAVAAHLSASGGL